MKTVTIKVGQGHEFSVPIIGEPPPELKWSFNDKPIENDPRIKVIFLFIIAIVHKFINLIGII